MTQKCLLNEHKRGGCASCPANCQHAIAMNGLGGNGGRIASANIPQDYRNITLATSPARDGQAELYRKLSAYVATFDRQFEPEAQRIKSLYLWSESPGTGKSTTACAIISEWLIAHYLGSIKRGVMPAQVPAYFLDVNAWQELYTGFTRQGVPQEVAESNSRPYYRQLELAKKTPFVVLDDIGVRSASDGFRSDLHTIINYRTVNGLPTVYTSNLPISEMATVFDARLYDRINDQCAVFHFEGESKRGKR